MDDQKRLAEIKARRSAVIDVPWESDRGMTISIYAPDGGFVGEVLNDGNCEFVIHAPADVDWLVSKVERLRDLLGRLEWGGWVEYRGPQCLACDGLRTDGHEPDCWLAKELRAD
jgi:hypothetical protein